MTYEAFNLDPQVFRYDPNAAEDRRAEQDLETGWDWTDEELLALQEDLDRMEIEEPDADETAEIMRRYHELRRKDIAEQG